MDASRINGEPFREGLTSAPILESMGVYVECRVKRILEGDGDHAVVLLEVQEVESRRAVTPLTIQESPWEYGG